LDMKDLRDNPAIWQILEERARALTVREVAAEAETGEEILIFQLGGAGYSVPAQFIREVQPLGDVTPLPSTPLFVVGLINVRGRLLTALDIRPLLAIPPAAPQADAYLLVLMANGMEVGLLADTVTEVSRSADALAPVPSTAAGRGAAWVRGVDRRLNLLLDPEVLLADPRLTINSSSG